MNATDHTTSTTAREGSPTMTVTTQTTAETEVPATLTAAEELAELLAEHGAEMVTGPLGDGINGWGAFVYGRIMLVFPEGQDPAARLDDARREIARLEGTALAFAPCDNAWCKEDEAHTWCYGQEIGLPPVGDAEPGDPILVSYLQHDRRAGETFVNFSLTGVRDTRFRTGDELRAETARVRAHLTRLDAMADQLDAIREAAGTGQQTAAGGHFPWCAPGQCIEHPERPDWPTEHQGPRNELPESRGRNAEPIGYSRLVHCPDDGGEVQLSTSFRGEGTTYTAAEADALIGNVEAFLTGLKAQRAQMGAQLRDGSAR